MDGVCGARSIDLRWCSIFNMVWLAFKLCFVLVYVVSKFVSEFGRNGVFFEVFPR